VSVLISAFNALTLSPALSPFCFVHGRNLRDLSQVLRRVQSVVRKNDGRLRCWSHVLIRRWGIALLLLLGISVIAVTMGKSLPSSFVPEEDQDMRSFSSSFRMLLLCSAPTPSCAKWMTFWRTLTGFRIRRDRRLQPLVQYFCQLHRFLFPSIRSVARTREFRALRKWFDADSEPENARGNSGSYWICLRTAAIPGLGTAGGFRFMLQDRSAGTVQQLSETLDKLNQAAGSAQKLVHS